MKTNPLTLKELARLAKSGAVETALVVFTDPYGRFMGKRFAIDFFLERVVSDGTHACDYLLTADMEMEPVPGYTFANWERGYGDVHLVPDFATLRVASWLPKTALVLCDVFSGKTHARIELAPRSILRRQVEAATRAGGTAMAASELEYYIFQNSYRDAAAKNYTGLDAGGWYLEDYHALQGSRYEAYHSAVRGHLKKSGVPVESSKGEWGLGQHELNVRYTDALAMADRHAIFKQCLKEVADTMGLSVTFMAKFAAEGAGSSCHLHLSLRKGNRNAFAGRKTVGPIRGASDTFRWFLGGWMRHVPDVMVFYAPTINSYKRYQTASWAPTRIAWSHDNRTAGFRIVGTGESLRIECRIPGADCNPYLAFAASLASGLDGIANKIEPPPVFDGDVYAARQLPHVPHTLAEATELFATSAFAKKVFGAEVVGHYTHFYRTEEAMYRKAVTDWERKRYFERI